VLTRIGPTVWVIIGSYPGTSAAPTASLIQQVPALIDTGATLSCIDDMLAQELQLQIVDQWITSGVSGSVKLDVYLAQITIPSLNVNQFGRFAGVHLQVGGQAHRALIGRSFLAGCTLVYDGKRGSVLLAR
jgi:predicted aspartyl protease